jgi:NAD(P)-dependent dehydrogenase (short-subunit alcohol dehydrogenase family)
MTSGYSSSKFAMRGYTDGLRRELNDFGISVSIVEPGYVNTPIVAKSTQVSVIREDKKELIDQFYSRHYDAVAQEKEQTAIRLADEPTVTSAAIFDALTSKYPKTRYPVANAGGVPAMVLDWLTWLPARLVDQMLS